MHKYMRTFRAKDENRRVIKEVYKKVEQIQKILVDEFPEVSKDRIELIANRLYDQIMYEDKDI